MKCGKDNHLRFQAWVPAPLAELVGKAVCTHLPHKAKPARITCVTPEFNGWCKLTLEVEQGERGSGLREYTVDGWIEGERLN